MISCDQHDRVLSSLVTMVMSVYLSHVLPSEYGVRKSVFFPIIGKNITVYACKLIVLEYFI